LSQEDDVHTLSFLRNDIDYDIETTVCNNLFGNVSFDDSNSTFTTKFITQTLILCKDNAPRFIENSEFEPLYFSYFNGFTTYAYSIINHDNYEMLTLIDSNGNTITYTSHVLNVKENKNLVFSVSPNPFSNTLKIITENNLDKLKMQISNLSGQALIEKLYQNQEVLNLESLSSGVYIISIENELGEKAIRKIVKL